MFQKMLQQLYAWLAPYTCILCHYPSGRDQDLCQPCFNELPILPQSCPRCATILTFPTAPCGVCLKKLPPMAATHVLFLYQPPVTKWIMELKFHENLINARLLGELMSAAIRGQWYTNKPLPDLIIPIPLHRERLKERGFNQAVEICRPIAKTLRLPLDLHSCTRIKNTAAQARQGAKDRQHNLRGAFHIEGDFSGKRVAIVDDVMTTGSTVQAFVHALKQAGAAQIDIWCCAKAVLD